MANPSRVCAAVRSIKPYGNGVYAVEFDVPSRFTRFTPGQFLHLTLDEFDPTVGYWPESRVFSIASEPRRDSVTIVYSVKGSYTRRMESELAPGRSVWLKLPYGEFVITEALVAQGPVVLVAGGTGVSPYWPFLKTLRAAEHAVHLFYGVREPQHILFRDDLVGLLQQPWFRLHLHVEAGSVAGLNVSPGRLTVEGILGALGDEGQRANFFLSGPPSMIQAFRADLAERGFSVERIHKDEWE